MRKFLMCCLIALTATLLSAQTDQRKNSGTTPPNKTVLTPTNISKQQKTTSNHNAAGSRSNNNNSAPTRPTAPNTGSNLSNTTRTKTNQPAPAGTSRTLTARPSLSNGTTKTAKSVTKTGQKAIPLKNNDPVSIKWMTIEQAIEKSKTEKKKIFIDVYTNWCGWCKHLDSTTFVNPAVAQYLNDHYYPVKFNAEQQQEVVFKDKTYRFKRSGSRGHHELAAEWLNNRLSYPTVVFLDENMGTIQPLPGYQDAGKLEAILNYFGTDSHKTTPWETYERKFSAGEFNDNKPEH